MVQDLSHARPGRNEPQGGKNKKMVRPPPAHEKHRWTKKSEQGPSQPARDRSAAAGLLEFFKESVANPGTNAVRGTLPHKNIKQAGITEQDLTALSCFAIKVHSPWSVPTRSLEKSRRHVEAASSASSHNAALIQSQPRASNQVHQKQSTLHRGRARHDPTRPLCFALRVPSSLVGRARFKALWVHQGARTHQHVRTPARPPKTAQAGTLLSLVCRSLLRSSDCVRHKTRSSLRKRDKGG